MAAQLPRIPQEWKNDRANDIESVTVEASPFQPRVALGRAPLRRSALKSIHWIDLTDKPVGPHPSDGAKWEVKPYFSNPATSGGYFGRPKHVVHGGIKIYRNGKFVHAIDAHGQRDHFLKDQTLGNLILERNPDNVSEN